MLAQNFKTPADLGLTDSEFGALVEVLHALERGELRHVFVGEEPRYSRIKSPDGFNMVAWDCGTAACIGGWAARLTGVTIRDEAALDLMYPGDTYGEAYNAGPSQAAIAVRNFLTYGEPRWKEAMAG